MVSERPSAPVGEGCGDGELPRFGLVTLQQRSDQENHALTPGVQDGPALCGLAEPVFGWSLVGVTSRLYRIDCHACRERAAAVLAALSERADQSGETGHG